MSCRGSLGDLPWKKSEFFRKFLAASKTEGTIHGILLQLNLDLSDELRERIKKLKANTFQDGSH